MNYNIPIYNENQYANLFTFRRKGVYIFREKTKASFDEIFKRILHMYNIYNSFLIIIKVIFRWLLFKNKRIL